MATSEFDHILDECLDRVLGGEESVEACARRYPDHVAELEPLLRLALDTQSSLSFTPTAAAKTRARLLLQAAIARRQARTPRRWRWPSGLRLGGAPRWAVSVAAVALMISLGGTGIVAASQDSMPDQPLYPVKRVVEEARLMLTRNPESRAQLHVRFADRRVEEIAVLSKKGKAQRVISLTADLDHHLRRIQRSAFPEAVPARPLLVLIATSQEEGQTPPLSIVSGTAIPPTRPSTGDQRTQELQTSPGQKMERVAEPRPLPLKAGPTKRFLRRDLVAGFKRQEEALKQAFQTSRGPARQRLQQTLQILREHREALLTALAESGAPERQATPTRP